MLRADGRVRFRDPNGVQGGGQRWRVEEWGIFEMPGGLGSILEASVGGDGGLQGMGLSEAGLK